MYNPDTDVISQLSHKKMDDDHVHVNEFVVVKEYQRAEKPVLISEIAKNFVAEKFGRITSSLRDNGTLAILDGQQRRRGAIARGMETVPATVYYGLTVEEEAALYVGLNRKVTQMPLEIFKAKVASGDEDAVSIVATLARYGVRVAFTGSHTDFTVNAISRIEDIVREWGINDLSATVSILVDAFGGSRDGLTAPAIAGMHAFVVRYRGKFDRERLVKKLNATGSRQMTVVAKECEIDPDGNKLTSASAYGVAIRRLYNQRLGDDAKLAAWAPKAPESPAAKQRVKAAAKIEAERRSASGQASEIARKAAATIRSNGGYTEIRRKQVATMKSQGTLNEVRKRAGRTAAITKRQKATA